MKYVISMDEIKRMKEYLQGKNTFADELDGASKKAFLRKVKNFILKENILWLKSENKIREVIADNDTTRLAKLFKSLYLPDHTGMKAMYENSKRHYVGFKRERLNSFVSNCMTCK